MLVLVFPPPSVLEMSSLIGPSLDRFFKCSWTPARLEEGRERDRSRECLFSVQMSQTSMRLPARVRVLPSSLRRSFMGRRGLCYCCNGRGICWPSVLSPRWAGSWSCRGWSPPLPRPSASCARSARQQRWRDRSASLCATCGSAGAGWPLRWAATEEEGRVSALHTKRRFPHCRFPRKRLEPPRCF